MTDTPEKLAIELAEKNKKKKGEPKPKSVSAILKNKTVRALFANTNDDTFCLVCGEPYSNSRSRETWVQCINCKLWAQEECTDGTPAFVCENCLE